MFNVAKDSLVALASRTGKGRIRTSHTSAQNEIQCKQNVGLFDSLFFQF